MPSKVITTSYGSARVFYQQIGEEVWEITWVSKGNIYRLTLHLSLQEALDQATRILESLR